jgi:hypothetical protein
MGDVQATADLQGPLSTIDDMIALLRRERNAVAQLDKTELQAVSDGRSVLVTRLKVELQGQGVPQDPAARERFSEAVRRLVAEAAVNAALLRDASNALAELMGQSQSSGTYDAKGTLSRAVSPIARTTL